ncbi:MAG: glycosyltransferase family 4 protein [Acidobacteria bacterium]|nr:glycosyltransferase family 4 protein [Acidobacteriota bacterium]
MPPLKIVVCEAQVPFVEGGAESHVRQLIERLRARGHQVSLVAIPFKWYPKEEILAHAAAWRLIDLSESNGEPIDLVIATKFPTYFARHPNKVTWLIHQYRAAYELCGTVYSDFEYTERDVGLRDRLMRADRQMLLESRRIFTNAANTARRLEKFLGVAAEPLYHPPRLGERLRAGRYDPYVLSVGRIESIKRVDLAIRALQLTEPPLRLVVVGTGSQHAHAVRAARESGVADRVDFLGSVDDERLIGLYADALAVIYAPFDEDFGYVTLEAFLAAKPVLTATDSGGPLEFVRDRVNGRVAEPTAEAIGAAIRELAADPGLARTWGEAGRVRAKDITWDGVVDKLVLGTQPGT